jgi:hypothetical protein
MADDKITFNFDQARLWLLDAARKHPDVLMDVVEVEMILNLADAKREIKGRTPTNLGDLKRSIDDEITTKTASHMEGEIMTGSTYALPVEKGRKAGKWPPISAIRAWVVQKGIAKSEKEVDSVTFLIARAIGKGTTKGIMKQGKGAKMFEKGFEAADSRMRRRFARIPEKFLARLSGA